MNLLGHRVWFAPRALVYHKHHGTSGKWPEPPRLRLYERNSLRMLYALLDDESLRRALPAALLLAADRALMNTAFSRVHDSTLRPGVLRRLRSPRLLLTAAKHALVTRGIARGSSIGGAVSRLGVRGCLGVAKDIFVASRQSAWGRRSYAVGVRHDALVGPVGETIPIEAAAAFSGLLAFLSELPGLASRRTDIQARRRVSDEEILKTFGTHWLRVCPAAYQGEHNKFQHALVEHFRITASEESAGSRSRS